MTTDVLAALADRFRFAPVEFTSSPLYGRLGMVVAHDPDLLAIAAQGRAGQQPPNLFFAAVHFLLLDGVGTDHELASYYASVAGPDARPVGADVDAAFHDYCVRHRDALVELVATRLVQTNVVRRSAALAVGLGVVGRRAGGAPVHFVEVGCSAGVHLRFDRYHYAVGDHAWGDVESLVRIDARWIDDATPRSPRLHDIPPIASRLGVDLHPIDPTDPVERRWLHALVWPENRHEAQLLDAALAVVADDPSPPPVLVGDIADVATDIDASLPRDEPVVVFHAATRGHVPRDRRVAFDAAIAGLGLRRPLYWLSLEGPLFRDERIAMDRPTHVLALRSRGATVHIAAVEGHAETITPLDL